MASVTRMIARNAEGAAASTSGSAAILTIYGCTMLAPANLSDGIPDLAHIFTTVAFVGSTSAIPARKSGLRAAGASK